MVTKHKRRGTSEESQRLIKLKHALDMKDPMNDDFVEILLERVSEAQGRGANNLSILEAVAGAWKTT